MKVLKVIFLVLLVLIAIPLIAGLFLPKEMAYEKSIEINASVDRVWEHVNSLEDMDQWSPWGAKDPNMKKEWSGTSGEVGSVQHWDSEVETVGKGSQTIARLQAPNLLETDLKFLTPYESEAKAFVKLAESGANTTATWGFKGEMPYPMNVTLLFMDMEAAMGEDFGYGLGKLKELAETPLPEPEPEPMEGEAEAAAEATS